MKATFGLPGVRDRRREWSEFPRGETVFVLEAKVRLSAEPEAKRNAGRAADCRGETVTITEQIQPMLQVKPNNHSTVGSIPVETFEPHQSDNV